MRRSRAEATTWYTEVVTRNIHAEPVLEAGADLGEGPCWDLERGLLTWVDITAGRVHLMTENGTPQGSHEVATHVGAALPADGGGWLLAVRDGFVLLSQDGSVTEVCTVGPDRPDIRFNDAKVDPAGRAFGGTMAYDTRAGAAALYRLDSGPQATVVLDGLTLSNGLGWSPDAGRFYFIDSHTQQVAVHDYDLSTGELGGRAVLVEIPEADGMPDGLCVDDDGCVWVALWGGAKVHRYTPDGRLDTVLELPVSQPTSCAFGGASGDILFITTAVFELDDATRRAEPLGGALFACRPGVTGPAATPWRPV